MNQDFHFHKFGIFLLFFSMILLPGSILGQTPWSLEDCINYALDNNLQLKRQELVAESSRANLFQSKMQLLPNVGGFAQHNFSSGKTVNLEDYTYVQQKFQDGNLGAQASVDLFNGLQQTNIIKRNKYNFLATIAEVDKAKNEMIIDISLAYMTILFNEELYEIAEAQLEAIQNQVERTSKFVEVGSRPQGDLLDIKSQAAAERLNLTTVGNQLKTSYLDLTQLLDLDSVGDFRIQKPSRTEIELESMVIPLSEVYGYAVSNFPEIKGAEYSLLREKKNLAVARGQRSPRIYVRGLIYSRYSQLGRDPLDPDNPYPYSDQLRDNQYQQLSFNLNIPIFQQWVIQNSISNAKISLMDAELNLDQQKQILYKSIQQTHLDAVAALERYRTSLEVVASRQMAFDYSEEKLNAGLENSTDYNIAKNNLIKAQAELLQAKYEYIFTSKILDFYRGIPISME